VDKTSPQSQLSPRAARTRRALLDAGMELLARRSVDAIAIDELVAAAGVAKGSFFNHFEDKSAYAAALYASVRGELEAAVDRANADTTDPLQRLSGGMISAAAFALSQPKRFAVMVRTASGLTLSSHPLNSGLAKDLRLCVRARVIRVNRQRSAVAFWIGCCQTLMIAVAEQRATPERTLELLSDMLVLGLSGLGAEEVAVARIVDTRALRDRFRALLEAPQANQAARQVPKE
jgi:AcrR family transcriptional regulator